MYSCENSIQNYRLQQNSITAMMYQTGRSAIKSQMI